MNIDNASTEAMAIYTSLHNQLNVSGKVAMGALTAIRPMVDGPDGHKLMGKMVDDLEMPWGKGKAFPKPTATIDHVIDNLGYFFLIQSFSAFEYYLQHVVVDLAHFSDHALALFKHAHTDSEYDPQNPPEYSKCCFAYAEQLSRNNPLVTRINAICSEIVLNDVTLTELLKLFEFFRLVRNCVAHSEGVINKELSEYASEVECEQGFQFWNGNFARGKSPRLPEIKRGEKIQLSLTHAIFSSAVNYKIGRIIDQHAVHILGLSGIVRMAQYYSLLVSDHDYRKLSIVNSADAMVSNFLVGRYLVLDVTKDKTIEQLRLAGDWKVCRARFELMR
jgi:hypothetical protein